MTSHAQFRPPASSQQDKCLVQGAVRDLLQTLLDSEKQEISAMAEPVLHFLFLRSRDITLSIEPC
jgi:hypothetical protein